MSTGIPDAEVDVLIVIEAVRPGGRLSAPVTEWPNGYFELFGSLREVNLERPPQGELQDRLPVANICIRFLNGRSASIEQKLVSTKPPNVKLCFRFSGPKPALSVRSL